MTASQLSRYAGVRALVVGATGFIGRWVARMLGDCGAHLWLVARQPDRTAAIASRYGLRGTIVELDLDADGAGVRTLYRSVRPSLTFNLAGYGVDPVERDEPTAYRINAGAVGVLCEAAAEARDAEWTGAQIVHAGSALEYGTVDGSLHEGGPVCPTTLYGKSKLAGTERLAASCATHGVRGVTARLFTVYGPGEREGRLVPSLLRAARTGETLRLTAGAQRRDFTYVTDVVEALLRLGLAPTGTGDVVNVATGRLTSVREFVEIAAGVLGLPAGRLAFGALPDRPEEMRHAEVTVARLRERTGWIPPTPIAEGIRRTMAFYANSQGTV